MEGNLNNQIALFKGKAIRRAIYKKEWWFSVIDVVEVLTESPTPRQYLEKVKKREFADFQTSPIWGQLKLTAIDGKMRETDCANTEGIFRIVQSIPSPKAEPLKRWLAKVGYERMQEIENPELATKRTRLYQIIKNSFRSRNQVFKLVEFDRFKNEAVNRLYGC